ncbi:MAG: PQQ-dependent sugar dehydrogenase, partial [Gammaproteobacteria bacterium]|nr:PQQ-dependent sugar dehydrogenase [Gammaproteobacteria bacterium]
HRLHDDGRIPTDNPFVGVPGALSTIWTYGHRAPQGLAYDPGTRNVWNTEHGPRGGDELNRLLPGRNYGWPLFSAELNYDGTEVAWGRAESEIALEDTERAAKAWSPSIAVSNLVVYEGAAFPEWQGDLLIGSLKASDLIRVEVEDGRVVGEELLLEDLARLRDVDVDERGWIYLLLEHQTGGRIVRLKPAPTGG